MNFHNPYHFVPTSEKPGPDSVLIQDFIEDTAKGRRPAHLTHARYVRETSTGAASKSVYSGRLVCRLVTESPLVVGSEQKNNDADEVSVVAPFTVNDQPAIPGSSLRGLISSIAEAASNSALRVLHNQSGYSFRRGMSEGLSALGMVVVRDGPDGRRHTLRPLTIPHLRARRNASHLQLEDALPEGVRGRGFSRDMFPEPNLKAYLGEKEDRENPENSIHSREFPNAHPTFQDSPSGTGPYFGAKLAAAENERQWTAEGCLPKNEDWQRFKGDILIAQWRSEPELVPWPNDQEKAAVLAERRYTRGILRTLGVTEARLKHMPTKKHELFIPFPSEMEADFVKPPRPGHWREFPILEQAVERFHTLADERAEAENTKTTKADEALPYHPVGTLRRTDGVKKNDPPHTFRLKTGDIVFFRPTANGQAIAEISLSSIWRGQVATIQGNDTAPPALPADFFATINPDLVPLGAEANAAKANPKLRKQRLTLAELLFGFVEQRSAKNEERSEKAALAFAGRIRPAALALLEPPAQAGDCWYRENSPDAPALNEEGEQWFTLKILASPKPPSPAMYFKPKQGAGYIAKKNLEPGAHHPQGRKFYLHHGENPRDWQTHPGNREDLRKQKMSVRPVRAGLTFWFHFDFDNLSETELQLLCYALRPTDQFRHKLGLGKPLGLGTVQIEPMGLFLVDRARRYSVDSLRGKRYHHIWTVGGSVAWHRKYDREHQEARSQNAPLDAPSPDTLGRQFEAVMQRLAPEIIHALKLIGEPGHRQASTPVHYPQVAGATGAAAEKEHYRWFVENDRDAKKALGPLRPEDLALPTLPCLQVKEPSSQRSHGRGFRAHGP